MVFLYFIWAHERVNFLAGRELVLHLPASCSHSRVPAQVGRIGKEDAGPRHGGWGGRLQVSDLEHQPHGGGEGHTLVTGQGKHLME